MANGVGDIVRVLTHQNTLPRAVVEFTPPGRCPKQLALLDHALSTGVGLNPDVPSSHNCAGTCECVLENDRQFLVKLLFTLPLA